MIDFKTGALRAIPAAAALCVGLAGTTPAHAAEAFEPRYNMAGSLGGEMFVPPDQAGWAGGVAVTHISVSKVTGNDGQAISTTLPGGVVPLPAPTPAALYPTYGTSTAHFDATGPMTRVDLAIGYITPERYAGGQFAFVVDVPYGRKKQDVNITASTPGLNWNPAIPAPVQSAVQAQFGAQYQAQVDAQSADFSGEVTGIGDVELQAGWLYTGTQVHVLAGASVVLPTGKYDTSPGPHISTGNYYTLRPALQLAWLPTPEIGLATKMSVGLNTRNKDNELRSGNWVSVEAAAGYKTAVGVVGVHGVYLRQYQDDDNNPFGASRFRSNSAGMFFTTKVPGIDAALTLQYMTTTSSRNAKHGDFTQLRLVKVF
ncbi:transporter [Duganella sp. LX20W]|uniref:Transporter n=1 Tax=Rugamonas brunnea TaxID=2758569 RepID=A0A7W2ID86_9BURK|nr:transporter [Rugamonas brunnea]MBA5639134.1 transporter [Rugamonas brunnea]